MWHLFISPISFSNFLCLPHWKSYSVTCLLFLKETKLCDPSEYHCYYLGKIFITTSSPPQATTASWFLLNLQVSAIVAPHPRLGYIFWQYPRLCLYTVGWPHKSLEFGAKIFLSLFTEKVLAPYPTLNLGGPWISHPVIEEVLSALFCISQNPSTSFHAQYHYPSSYPYYHLLSVSLPKLPTVALTFSLTFQKSTVCCWNADTSVNLPFATRIKSKLNMYSFYCSLPST